MGISTGGRNRFIPWSKEDTAKLTQLCKAVPHYKTMIGAKRWDLICAHFPTRTRVAVKQHWSGLKAKAAGKPPRIRYDRLLINPSIVRHSPQERAIRQNPVQLPPPKSITAFICGDPLPGRSALDRKLQGANA